MKLDIDDVYIYDNYNVEQFNTVVVHSMINHYDHDMVFRCRSTHNNPNRQWVDEVLLCMCVFQMISHGSVLTGCMLSSAFILDHSVSACMCMCMWLSLMAGGIIGSPSGIYLDKGNNGMSQWDVLVNGFLLMFQVIAACSCHCFHPDSRLPCHSC